jgi:hypothetical protein
VVIRAGKLWVTRGQRRSRLDGAGRMRQTRPDLGPSGGKRSRLYAGPSEVKILNILFCRDRARMRGVAHRGQPGPAVQVRVSACCYPAIDNLSLQAYSAKTILPIIQRLLRAS